MTLSRLLLKLLDKIDFSKLRKAQGLPKIHGRIKKLKDLGRKPKEW